MVRHLPCMSIGQYAFAFANELALSWRETLMQTKKEFKKSARECTLWIEVLRRGVDVKTVQLVHAGETVTGVSQSRILCSEHHAGLA